MMSAAGKMLHAMASLRLTLVWLGVAAAIAVTGEIAVRPIGVWMALPFAALFLNLMAAIATTPKLRRQGGLLGFHLALASLALLAAADRLVSLSGHVEITEGTAFDERLVNAVAGPLHPWRLDGVRFVQEEFVIDYAPSMKRRETYSAVRIPTEDGGWRRLVVGDDDPVVVDGYRFYTSFNKGFAPLITYVDGDGRPHSGAVHLPSYPLNYYRQGNDWALPGGAGTVKLWLQIPQPVYDENSAWRFRKPTDAVLVVIDGEGRHELRPGESLPLRGGALRYDELRSWMGYTISYSPVASWMLAAAVVAVLSLAWHMAWKFSRYSWQDVGVGKEIGNDG